jgi:hypothetical protein
MQPPVAVGVSSERKPSERTIRSSLMNHSTGNRPGKGQETALINRNWKLNEITERRLPSRETFVRWSERKIKRMLHSWSSYFVDTMRFAVAGTTYLWRTVRRVHQIGSWYLSDETGREAAYDSHPRPATGCHDVSAPSNIDNEQKAKKQKWVPEK